ncbi:MAG TPA: CoA pyrophosphatase [Candidatus Sulfotelmatobacter sp.]|nr:CoA pyrophosphatase [Candidatus Sulfotelmatobacter sp.]
MSRAEIIRRLAQSRPSPATLRGDHMLDRLEPPPPPLKPAAVLVPIVEHADALTVLLTKRTDHLADHAGQVSFPGGRIEPEDPDPERAALREAHEEVGLPADRVELVGRLDIYRTRTGFEVVPVVGLVRPPLDDLKPDPYEVAEVFEVPLSFILDPINHELHTRELRGMTRTFYVLPYQGRYIWGATAGMLVNLAQVLRP